MGRWILLLTLVALATLVSAQNDTSEPTAATTSMFGVLPEGNYTSDVIEQANVGSLQGLFDMARGFVVVVFQPFSELQVIVEQMLESGDAIAYLEDNWQEVAKFKAGYIVCLDFGLLFIIFVLLVAKFEVGYIVCLVFGLLFVIFVPLVGSFMCCCRCCCGNCGGRLEQSQKRSKSCWRQCLCVSMLILTTLMAVPTVFVFLTNEWITDVVETSPVKINSILEDSSAYLKLVPTQVQYITDQYTIVDNNVRPIVEDFGVSIGEPLQKEVEGYTSDTMTQLDTTIIIVNNILQAINDVDSSLEILQANISTVDDSLKALQNLMETDLNVSSCISPAEPNCTAVYLSRDGLSLGFDVNELNGLSGDLDTVNDTLTSYDLGELQNNITKEIDDIPQKTKDQTAEASTEALSALDSANETMSDISTSLPTDSFEDIDNQINDLKGTIDDAFATYNDSFDQYRYIAGVVLGSMLAVIVGFYLLGMLLGVCGHDRKVAPSQRGGASNCGGIMLMVGVGLSFIFSWLLMILVVVTFTIGGHAERYGCQSLEAPNYEALPVIINQTNIDINNALGLPDEVTLTFKEVLDSCEKNAGVYTAFKLENIVNITKELETVTTQTDDLETQIDEAVADIDLSTISVYSEEDQAELLALQNSGLEGINFTDYISKLGVGIVATPLPEYALFLRAQATATTNATHKSQIEGYADEVERIQKDEVASLQASYDLLEKSINTLQTESASLNGTLIALDESLFALNETIQAEAPEFIATLADDLSQQIVGNITSYSDWVGEQVETELGACRPIYTSYTDTLGVFCDYLIDTINGLWFSLGWCIFFLIPSAIVAMKLMKFFRRMSFEETYEEDFEDNLPPLVYLPALKNYYAENTRSWNDMEMRDYGNPGNDKGNGYY